jgi:hypothetical protein
MKLKEGGIMKNIKYVLMGIILGAVLFGVFPVTAAIQEYICYKADYKLIIKGVEFQADPEFPILNYKGRSYLPVADAFKAAGLNVNWNAELKQAEVMDPIANTVEGVNTMSETIIQTPDGITQIDTWGGKQYIGFLYVRNKIREKGYDFVFDTNIKQWRVVKGEDILINDVPTTMLTDFGYDAVEVNYYINNILPLIQ